MNKYFSVSAIAVIILLAFLLRYVYSENRLLDEKTRVARARLDETAAVLLQVQERERALRDAVDRLMEAARLREEEEKAYVQQLEKLESTDSAVRDVLDVVLPGAMLVGLCGFRTEPSADCGDTPGRAGVFNEPVGYAGDKAPAGAR